MNWSGRSGRKRSSLGWHKVRVGCVFEAWLWCGSLYACTLFAFWLRRQYHWQIGMELPWIDGEILLAPVFMSAMCALVICPLFVLIAIVRSDASPGQRLVVLLVETFLIALQLLRFCRRFNSAADVLWLG